MNINEDEFYRRQEIENWSEPKKMLYQNLDKLIDFHVSEIINKLFEEKELQEIFENDGRENAKEIWSERFLEYTLNAIRLVKPSKRIMNDSMDINDYVEIKLIEYENDSKCKYINGCVIMNNIADRRMKSNIENPQILLIGNSVGFCQEDSFADLETIIKQEDHYLKILMDRIEQVKPDVIIIEKDISRSVLAKLRDMNITVITNVERKSIEKIARWTETLITPSINLIEKRFILGTCKRFYVKIGAIKSIKDKSQIMAATQSLIYFDKWKPWYGSTICLSGPNQNHLKTFKKYLQKILKYSRDIILEKEYLFLSDGDSKDKEASPYLLPKIGFWKPSLKYVKVSIRQSIKDDALNSDRERDNNENNSGDEVNENIYGGNEAQVKKNMHHICGKPEKNNIEFYSQKDMTLREFLNKTAYEAVEKCENWREKNYKHVTCIYHGDGYIEISVFIKEHHPLLQNKAEIQDYK